MFPRAAQTQVRGPPAASVPFFPPAPCRTGAKKPGTQPGFVSEVAAVGPPTPGAYFAFSTPFISMKWPGKEQMNA